MSKTALIYNNYFPTAGGGERSALDVALALDQLGFDIVLATAQIINANLDEIVKPFGVQGYQNWKFLEFESEDQLANWVQEADCELFVNHTFGSSMYNPARYGVYVAMFPHFVSEVQRAQLHSYDFVACNSAFTENYVKMRWGSELQTQVLVPPISTKGVPQLPQSVAQKEKLIIVVGRFNVNGHNKKQLDAIQAFIRLRDAQVLDGSWKMVVTGHVNESPENEAYLAQCRATAAHYNIEIIPNIAFAALQALYFRASCLWQFTGFGLPFGEKPEHCEHLGLVALDCFIYGVIPIVYQRSGVSLLMRHGIEGYSFGTQTELGEIMTVVDDSLQSDFHEFIFNNLKQQATSFSFEFFRDSFGAQLQ